MHLTAPPSCCALDPLHPHPVPTAHPAAPRPSCTCTPASLQLHPIPSCTQTLPVHPTAPHPHCTQTLLHLLCTHFCYAPHCTQTLLCCDPMCIPCCTPALLCLHPDPAVHPTAPRPRCTVTLYVYSIPSCTPGLLCPSLSPIPTAPRPCYTPSPCRAPSLQHPWLQLPVPPAPCSTRSPPLGQALWGWADIPVHVPIPTERVPGEGLL